MRSHILPGRHNRSWLIWDISLFHTHHLLKWQTIFKAPAHLFTSELFRNNGEVESIFKDFFSSKPLQFYHIVIINNINGWQICICVQTLYFNLYFFFGGARGVMAIVVGNGHGDTSSNPGRDSLHFHIALIPLGKVWIQLFSLQLWINSRAD